MRVRSLIAAGRLVVILALAPASEAAGGAPAARATEATAFIRVRGDVRAEYTELFKEPREIHDVEIATGSGFVVSPAGYVLTNQHVIAGGEVTPPRGQTGVRMTLEVTKIEVVLPSESGGVRSFAASVEVVDPELDLAVLAVGAELPFLHMGDSDVLESGQPVTVWGFPFGGKLELGKTAAVEVPRVSTTRGLIGAIRTDDAGAPRYLQTDAAINPGSSGGPMLDADGFVVGLVELKLRGGVGIGFGIPINIVKDFLEAHGLGPSLPSRRLRAGGLQAVRGKRLSLALPDGMDDVSPHRLQCASGEAADEIALRVDRVFSPLALPRLESALLAGQAFESFASEPKAQARPVGFGDFQGLVGWARGGTAESGTRDVEYVIVDLGREKLVARYVGPTPAVAFNRGVLRASLHGLEAERLLTAEIQAPPAPRLEPVAVFGPAGPELPFPVGWVREPETGSASRKVPPPDAVVSASPDGDFTVSLRASWWRARPATPQDAAAARSPTRGAMGRPSYAFTGERLGVDYTTEGVFLALGDGLVQLEVDVPTAKRPFLQDLFTAWVKAASSGHGE
jgi:S1-C subfamily serine protease